MPEHNPNHLQSHYAQQVAADLENNSSEQERIRSEVAALQAQLETLQKDHELLVSMQAALGGTPAKSTKAAKDAKPAKTATGAKGATVPKARRASGSATTVAATTAKDQSKAAKKPAATTTAKSSTAPRTTTAAKSGTAPKTTATPLRELAVGILGRRQEPWSAAEVTEELTRAHPDRPLTVQLVRNALEASVAKNQSERSKQQNSVYYTAVGKKAAADEPAVAASTPDA
ncbi:MULTISPECIES: hypothetical protein [unclassified Streptomyces]|uniref:hypothetical protein n=1 Tax=unclassified Streptomyces TaxID=2593676 RepID=UPI00332D3B1E